MKKLIVTTLISIAAVASTSLYAGSKSEFLVSVNITAPNIDTISLTGIESSQRIRVCQAMCIANQNCGAFSASSSSCNLKGSVYPADFVNSATFTSGTVR